MERDGRSCSAPSRAGTAWRPVIPLFPTTTRSASAPLRRPGSHQRVSLARVDLDLKPAWRASSAAASSVASTSSRGLIAHCRSSGASRRSRLAAADGTGSYALTISRLRAHGLGKLDSAWRNSLCRRLRSVSSYDDRPEHGSSSIALPARGQFPLADDSHADLDAASSEPSPGTSPPMVHSAGDRPPLPPAPRHRRRPRDNRGPVELARAAARPARARCVATPHVSCALSQRRGHDRAGWWWRPGRAWPPRRCRWRCSAAPRSPSPASPSSTRANCRA